MYPMLEMAAGHFTFIPDVLYVYNQANTLNDFRQKLIRQIRCKYYVASKQKYTRIESLERAPIGGVDLLVLSDNAAHQFASNIFLAQRFLEGIDSATVLYRTDAAARPLYQDVHKRFPYINFVESQNEFIDDLIRELSQLKGAFVLVVDDSVAMHRACEVQRCAEALARTGAHAFYLSLSVDHEQADLPFIAVADDIYAWQFKHAGFKFKQPFSTRMVMYRKETVIQALEQFRAARQLYGACVLNDIQFDYEHIGLCFKNTVAQGRVDAKK